MKKIITLLLLAGMIFAFGGCGKDKSSSDDNDRDEDTVMSEEDETAADEDEYGETEEITEETTEEDVPSESVETVYLSDFIGKTVKDITDMYGMDYSVYDYNGGYFISYQNQPFSFFYRDPDNISLRSDVPSPTDEIFIVMAGAEGVAIFDGVEIGSRVAAIGIYLNRNIDIGYDEMECEYYTTFTHDSLRYVVYINEDTVITSCEVWDDSSENYHEEQTREEGYIYPDETVYAD